MDVIAPVGTAGCAALVGAAPAVGSRGATV